MSKKKQQPKFRDTWFLRNFSNRIRRNFLWVLIVCLLYQLSYHYFHFEDITNGWISSPLDYLHEFDKHYFPDLIAAFTIYMFIDEGIKMLVGTREEKRRDYRYLMNCFLSKTKKEIVIVDTFITELVERETMDKITQVFKECLKKGIRIKILLLYPGSQAFYQRIKDLNKSDDQQMQEREFRSKVKNNIIFLFKFFVEIKKLSALATHGYGDQNPLYRSIENVKILLYDRSPVMSYYGWDDTAYFSLMTPDSPTDNAPNLLISNYSLFGNYVRSLIDQIVDGSKENPSISIQDYMVMRLEDQVIDDINKTETYKILPEQNEIYFGFKDLRKRPDYITVKLEANDISRYFKPKCGNDIYIFYHGKLCKIKLLNVLEVDPPTNEYDSAILTINRLYNLNYQQSVDFFGKNPTIFEIEFV